MFKHQTSATALAQPLQPHKSSPPLQSPHQAHHEQVLRSLQRHLRRRRQSHRQAGQGRRRRAAPRRYQSERHVRRGARLPRLPRRPLRRRVHRFREVRLYFFTLAMLYLIYRIDTRPRVHLSPGELIMHKATARKTYIGSLSLYQPCQHRASQSPHGSSG